MKPDNFDDLFRRKLEDISPEFREDDWAGFQAHFRQNVPFKFTRMAIGKIAASVMLGVVLAASAATHWYQYQRNQALETEVASLKKELATRQSAITGTDSRKTPLDKANSTISQYPSPTQMPTAIPEVGTNISVKPAETNSDKAYSSINQDINSVSEVGSNKKNTAYISPNTTVNQREAVVLPNSSEALAGTKTTRNGQQSRAILSESKAERVYLSKAVEKVAEASSPKAGTLPYADRANPNSSIGFVRESPTPAGVASIASEVSKPPFAQELSKAFQSKLSTLNSHNTLNLRRLNWDTSEKIVAIAPPKETEQSIERMVFQMPTLRFRAGVGTGIEQGGFSKNVWGEVRLDKHFAISTGLQWLSLDNGKFFDEDMFKEKKRRDFRDINAPKPPPPNPIFNIEEHTKIIQIPVYATYRLPLKNNFTLLASAGATYDASVKKSYLFSVRKNTYELETNETPSDSESSSRLNFSGASVSVGAEKTFKNIVLQAEGYVSPSLGYASYRNNDQKNAVGARLKVMYAFGR